MIETEPANVLLLTAEDSLSDTVRPRLDALEADCSRIFAIEEVFTFDEAGLERLQRGIDIHQPRLVVIDPLSAYLGEGVDIFRDNAVRPILGKLAAIAEESRVAMLCIRHLTKSGRDKAIYRGQGSIAFTAAARSVLLVGADKDDPSQRAVLHIKSNVDKLGEPIGYEIREGQFFWTGTTDLTEDSILGSTSHDALPIDEAKQFLADFLAGGHKPAKQVLKEGTELGFSKSTLHRAKKRLKVVSKKSGFREGFTWELPPQTKITGEYLRSSNSLEVLNNNNLIEDSTPEYLRENLRENVASEDTHAPRRYSTFHPPEGENLRENLRDEERERLTI